jgi:hypothetical protein
MADFLITINEWTTTPPKLENIHNGSLKFSLLNDQPNALRNTIIFLEICSKQNEWYLSCNVQYQIDETVPNECLQKQGGVYHVKFNEMIHYNSLLVIVDKIHGYMFFPNEVNWTMSSSKENGIKGVLHVCYSDIQLCPKIIIPPDGYELIGDSLLIIKTGKILESSQYFISIDGRAIICSLKSGLTPLSVITVTGTAFSVTSLVTTFSIYLSKKNLRTIPGKMMMNYIVALVTAQVLLQSNDDFVPYPIFCKVVAAMLHYLWLATFTWLNAMSYRMFKTFTDIQFCHFHKRPKKDLNQNILYAWLSPLFVVIPCLCCDLFQTGWFQYGGANHCWISNVQKRMVLYTFASPVLFLVLINTILLTLCAAALHRTRSLISEVFQAKGKQIIRSYFGLFVMSGITWILGLLPDLTGIDFFWYPFILTNAFQGTFIFLVFGLPQLKCNPTCTHKQDM